MTTPNTDNNNGGMGRNAPQITGTKTQAHSQSQTPSTEPVVKPVVERITTYRGPGYKCDGCGNRSKDGFTIYEDGDEQFICDTCAAKSGGFVVKPVVDNKADREVACPECGARVAVKTSTDEQNSVMSGARSESRKGATGRSPRFPADRPTR